MFHLLHIFRRVCLQAAAGPEDTEFDSECTKVYESLESVYGKRLLDHTASVAESLELAKTQNISMQLYESRIASLQRAVAFFVMFHEMAAAVADFWSFVSFGFLGYRIDRTQSIMRRCYDGFAGERSRRAAHANRAARPGQVGADEGRVQSNLNLCKSNLWSSTPRLHEVTEP